MKITILSSAYRDRAGNDYRKGDVAELPDAIAVKLIKWRIAEPMREAPIERAVVEPTEKAVTTAAMKPPRGRPPKKR
ncbi:MAG: hypothetical protein KKC80_08865 [Candidatus Margulisbacteria bacterium]|nr:hypothetical protein [Candidatus Margulisiibacteriota bacterium]